MALLGDQEDDELGNKQEMEYSICFVSFIKPVCKGLFFVFLLMFLLTISVVISYRIVANRTNQPKQGWKTKRWLIIIILIWQASRVAQLFTVFLHKYTKIYHSCAIIVMNQLPLEFTYIGLFVVFEFLLRLQLVLKHGEKYYLKRRCAIIIFIVALSLAYTASMSLNIAEFCYEESNDYGEKKTKV